MNHATRTRLQDLLDRAVDGRRVFGTSFALRVGGETWHSSSGNFNGDESYFIASTTKLFVTTLILQLESESRLSRSDHLSSYFSENILRGLHTLDGRDHVSSITIGHLLAHTSGIPDYFMGREQDGNSLEKQLLTGGDRAWTFEESVDRSKRITPPFPPGARGRAWYSDTNYQLLGRILESVTGQNFATLVAERICRPLGLTKTYIYSEPADATPKPLNYESRPLHVPRAMVSFGPDGAAVSTATDTLVFIEAFFSGKLFPASVLSELTVWNPIFFPLQAGIGVQRFKLPRLFDPFGMTPELIGHSGLSGALAFFAPAKGVFIAGTVNQIASPGTSFRLAIKLVREATRKQR
jgi:D-alanyl-D-alanine carboxypeptidase